MYYVGFLKKKKKKNSNQDYLYRAFLRYNRCKATSQEIKFLK